MQERKKKKWRKDGLLEEERVVMMENQLVCVSWQQGWMSRVKGSSSGINRCGSPALTEALLIHQTTTRLWAARARNISIPRSWGQAFPISFPMAPSSPGAVPVQDLHFRFATVTWKINIFLWMLWTLRLCLTWKSAVFLGRTDFTAQHTDISMSTPLNDAAAPCTDHSWVISQP